MKIPRGFTLMELVVVLLFSSILVAGMVHLFSEAIDSLDDSETKVVAIQLAQERMEQVVAERRADGYDTFFTTGDTVTFDSVNYVRTVSSSAYSGAACPSGMSCKEVQVTVAVGGTTRAESTMLLVDY